VRRVGAEAEGGERRGRSSRAVRRPGASPAAAHQPTRLRTAPAPAATGRRHARTLSVRDPGMSTRLERLRCQGRILGGRPSRPPYFFPRVDDRMAVVWSSTGGGGAVHRRCVRSLAVRPGVDHSRTTGAAVGPALILSHMLYRKRRAPHRPQLQAQPSSASRSRSSRRFSFLQLSLSVRTSPDSCTSPGLAPAGLLTCLARHRFTPTEPERAAFE